MQSTAAACIKPKTAAGSVYTFTEWPSRQFPGLACTITTPNNPYQERLYSLHGNCYSIVPVQSLKQFIDVKLRRMFPDVVRQTEATNPFSLYYGLKQKWGLAELAEWKVLVSEVEPPVLQLICVTTDQRPDILIENTVAVGRMHSIESWRAFEHALINAVHRPSQPVFAEWEPLEESGESS